VNAFLKGDSLMGKIKKILILNNEVEAMLLDEILSEKNIPHVLRSYHDQVYDGIFQNQLGWGSIDADEIYREEIINIYHDILQNTQD
jgi:hypothetical protein